MIIVLGLVGRGNSLGVVHDYKLSGQTGRQPREAEHQVTKARQAASGPPAAKPPAGFLPLQHPRNVQYPPTGDDWRHEIKLDGYRMQLRVAGRGASWYSRNGNDWTARLPDFAASALALGEGTFDGELCALKGDGSPDFSALRSYMVSRQTGRIMGELTFIVFDLLADASGDLRGKPLEERRKRLQTMLGYEPASIRLASALPGHDGRALLDAACRLGLEGIVSKGLSSLYEGGERRPDTWVKAKCRPSQEVVIGGWEMNGVKFRSLLVACGRASFSNMSKRSGRALARPSWRI